MEEEEALHSRSFDKRFFSCQTIQIEFLNLSLCQLLSLSNRNTSVALLNLASLKSATSIFRKVERMRETHPESTTRFNHVQSRFSFRSPLYQLIRSFH